MYSLKTTAKSSETYPPLPGTSHVIAQEDKGFYCMFHKHPIIPAYIAKLPDPSQAACRTCLGEEMDLLQAKRKPIELPKSKSNPPVSCDVIEPELNSTLDACGWDICIEDAIGHCANPACELPLCLKHLTGKGKYKYCPACDIRSKIDDGAEDDLADEEELNMGKCEFCGDECAALDDELGGMCPRCKAETEPSGCIVVYGNPGKGKET